VRYSCKYAKP